jgi:putative methyltransferase (TIGR04325 family)
MQKITKIIKKILPPFLFKFILNNSPYFGFTIWKYAPDKFDTVISTDGWNLESIAAIQVSKWENYKNRIKSTNAIGLNHESDNFGLTNDPFFHNLLVSFAYVLGLSAISKKSIKVLDWGGGIGHYGLLSEELFKSTNLKIDYYCYDFPVFCSAGQKINPNYTFFNNENMIKGFEFDLIVASSSIWYEKDWKNGVNKLCNYNPEYLYITRMIFTNKGESYVALQKPKQKGYKTEYLFWVINEFDFVSYTSSKNYKLIREFEFGEPIPIFKAPQQGTYKGFLFKKLS